MCSRRNGTRVHDGDPRDIISESPVYCADESNLWKTFAWSHVCPNHSGQSSNWPDEEHATSMSDESIDNPWLWC